MVCSRVGEYGKLVYIARLIYRGKADCVHCSIGYNSRIEIEIDMRRVSELRTRWCTCRHIDAVLHKAMAVGLIAGAVGQVDAGKTEGNDITVHQHLAGMAGIVELEG